MNMKQSAVGGGSSRILAASTFVADDRLQEEMQYDYYNRSRSKSTLALNRRHAQANYFNLDQEAPHATHMRESIEALRQYSRQSFRNNNVRDPESGDSSDVFEFLAARFGFQRGNVDNQKEHLTLLIMNIRVRARNGDGLQNDLRNLHRKFFTNYIQWARFLGVQPIFSPTSPEMDIAMYLLIWGEAANLRFCPEAICFLYHNMSKKLYTQTAQVVERVPEQTFLYEVIKPLYTQLAKMKQFKKPDGSLQDHTKIRNYDDFNEFFWSRACLRFDERTVSMVLDKSYQKTFQEKRSIFNPILAYYRIYKFHLWVFHLLVALGYIAHLGSDVRTGFSADFSVYKAIYKGFTRSDSSHSASVIALFSVTATFAALGVFKAILELWIGGVLVFGNTSYGFALFVRLVLHSFFFACTLAVIYASQTKLFGGFTLESAAPIIAGVYLLPQLVWGFIAFNPNFIRNSNFWQYVRRGRDQYVGQVRQSFKTVMRYSAFWVPLWLIKIWVSFQFFLLPLIGLTMTLLEVDPKEFNYKDGWPLQFRNIGLILSFWLPTFIVYLYDAQIWFAIFEAFAGAILGWQKKIGDAHTLRDVRKRLMTAPFLFDQKIVTRQARAALGAVNRPDELKNQSRLRFAVVWNECINSFRLADLLDDREATVMQYDIRDKGVVNDPIFLTAGSIEKAILIAEKYKSRRGNDKDLRNKLRKKRILVSVVGCYTAIRDVVMFLSDNDPVIQNFFARLEQCATDSTLCRFMKLSKLRIISQAMIEFLAAILDMPEPTPQDNGGIHTAHRASELSAVIDRFEELVFQVAQAVEGQEIDISQCRILNRQQGDHFAAEQLRKLYDDRNAMSMASRAYLMLTVEAVDALPRCQEAQRRIGYFLHSLSMDIPSVTSVKDAHSFSVITPYYSEPVIYSIADLNTGVSQSDHAFSQLEQADRQDITILQYLSHVYPDEWRNFEERMGVQSIEEAVERSPMEVRLWASYRGQTLARTVRGMMLYEDAIKMLHWLEIGGDESISHEVKIQRMDEMVRLKFSYITGCQVYGKQKTAEAQQAEDIDFLMKMYPNWRVAYVDAIPNPDGSISKFNAVLIKSERDEIVEVYRYELPGDPILGEGKPENQNVALAFSRGEFIQAIDMNQEHYFEETLKIANFLATADRLVDGAPPTIIGMREYIFTGSASSLSTFMAWQELVFVTLNQRVLADPLRVRMHYGHPDFFDKIFCLTRGGMSKPSKGINLSEDIFAGFNTTVRGGLVTHEEFMQCGKGRDVALTQITLFETKIANGNSESSLSRDIHRMGSAFDFFRLCSVYYAHNGFYINTALTVFGIFAFMYCKIYLVLSQDLVINIVTNLNPGDLSLLDFVINTQFILQLGWLFTLPLFLCLLTEKGVLKSLASMLTLIITLGPLFYSFQMGTRHYFYVEGIIKGGAKYHATGRGFTIFRDQFAEIMARYSYSHFRMGWELVGTLIIFGVLGNYSAICDPSQQLSDGQRSVKNENLVEFCLHPQSYGVASFAVYFIAVCFIFSPFLFNTEGFEYRKTKHDIVLWLKWMFHVRKPGEKLEVKTSWEGWFVDAWSAYACMSFSSRIAYIFKESRHFFIGYLIWVSQFRYDNAWGMFVGAAAIMFLSIIFGGIARKTRLHHFIKAIIYLVLYVVIIVGGIIALSGMNLLDNTDSASQGRAAFAAFSSSCACLYGLMYVLMALNHHKLKLSAFFLIQEITFFFDYFFGVIQLVVLFILSAVPFISVMQARMMYNQNFTRAISGASQYAISVFFTMSMLAGSGAGMLSYIIGGAVIDHSLLHYAKNKGLMDKVAVVPLVGYGAAAVAVLLAAGAMAMIGRRYTIVLGCVFSFAGSALAGFVDSSSVFVVAFALLGVAVGILSIAVPLYNFEISTQEHRGKAVLSYIIGMAIGNLIIGGISSMITLGTDNEKDPSDSAWRLNLLYANVPLLFLIAATLYFVESPLYLFKKKGRAACEDCLIRLRRRHDVHAELELIAAQINLVNGSGTMMPRRVLVLFLQIAFALSSSTFIFYVKQNDALERFNRIAFPLFYLLGLVLGLAMVDRVKRKTILKDGMPMVLGAVVATAVCYNFIQSGTASLKTLYLAFLVILILVGATSYGAATWVTAFEIFPPARRLGNAVPGFFVYWAIQAALYLPVTMLNNKDLDNFQLGLMLNLRPASGRGTDNISLLPFYIVYGVVCVPLILAIFCLFASTPSGVICMKSEKAQRLKNDNLMESPALSSRSSARFRFKGNSVRDAHSILSASSNYSFIETPKDGQPGPNNDLHYRANAARQQALQQ